MPNGFSNFESTQDILRNPYFVKNDFPPGISSLFLNTTTILQDNELYQIFSNYSGFGSSDSGINFINFKAQLSAAGVEEYL